MNHIAPFCPALQVRAEVLGGLLAAAAFATPAIEQRLKELQPGRGRQAAATQVAGATSVFALRQGLPEAQQQVRLVTSLVSLPVHVCLLPPKTICSLHIPQL